MRFFDFFVLYLPNGKQVSSTTKPRFGGFFYDQLLARDGQKKTVSQTMAQPLLG